LCLSSRRSDGATPVEGLQNKACGVVGLEPIEATG
jgi:hypothetical protein